MSLSLDRRALCVFTIGIMLAGCGGRSDMMNSAALTSPALPLAQSVDSKLSGERFHSKKAHSHCSGYYGAFHASGTAEGPFPGTFTVRGTASGPLILLETFKIRSGSKSISGSADSQASGTPTYGCSRRGKLSFDFPILQYKEHRSNVAGSGYASLSGADFVQGFQ